MKENVMLDKAIDLGVEMLEYARYLRKEKKEYEIANQLVRSGTSIGANIAEANYTISKEEFISKLQIALKEANETRYWLVLHERTYLNNERIPKLKREVDEIMALLVSSIKTAKGNSKKEYGIK